MFMSSSSVLLLQKLYYSMTGFPDSLKRSSCSNNLVFQQSDLRWVEVTQIMESPSHSIHHSEFLLVPRRSYRGTHDCTLYSRCLRNACFRLVANWPTQSSTTLASRCAHYVVIVRFSSQNRWQINAHNAHVKIRFNNAKIFKVVHHWFQVVGPNSLSQSSSVECLLWPAWVVALASYLGCVA